MKQSRCPVCRKKMERAIIKGQVWERCTKCSYKHLIGFCDKGRSDINE